jgi:chromosome segregation ATPase
VSAADPQLEVAVAEAQREVDGLAAEVKAGEGALRRAQRRIEVAQAAVRELERALAAELARETELRLRYEEARRATEILKRR